MKIPGKLGRPEV